MQRAFIAAAVAALAVAITWGLLLLLPQETAEAPASAPDVYRGIPFDAHLLRLDREALEVAYKDRLVKLFGVWLTSTQAKDATNFTQGLHIARRGYNAAVAQIERREQQYREQNPDAR